jgi:hypothetical protein
VPIKHTQWIECKVHGWWFPPHTVCKDCDPVAYMAAKRGDVRAAEQAQQRRGQDERPKELHYWPWCATCRMPFAFDNDEPFAHCGCGTTEWGDPRPAPWVTAPVDRQRLQEEVQSMLRKAAEAFAAEVEQSFITGSKRTTQPAAAPDIDEIERIVDRVEQRQAHVASDIENTVLREALKRIADKDGWARKYPQGNYECIAVECIGIARDALRVVGVKT